MIHTERLTIRRITESDWQSVQGIWEDLHASAYAQYDRPQNTESAAVQERIARWARAGAQRERLFFAICLGETVIGYCAFNRRADGYEVGYCFHSAYHGKGYAKESISALMGYMKSIGVRKITAGTALANRPSVRLLTALGFRQTGTEKVSFYQDANGCDIVFDGGIYELTL